MKLWYVLQHVHGGGGVPGGTARRNRTAVLWVCSDEVPGAVAFMGVEGSRGYDRNLDTIELHSYKWLKWYILFHVYYIPESEHS